MYALGLAAREAEWAGAVVVSQSFYLFILLL
jgi:hypothetical protein